MIYHADVFSKEPYAGNGLTVVFCDSGLSQEEMQRMACEFKQFETIFLKEIRPAPAIRWIGSTTRPSMPVS